ncbi:MAG: hypothetical protein WCQ99_10850, partial [Pseudomonadota bacterium]
VSSQEEFLIDHYERLPVMPLPLIVEALAQLGGWTITVSSEYRYLAIMVMVKDVEASGLARPGDQIELQVAIENINEYGATISSAALVEGKPIVNVGSLTYVLYEIPEPDRQAVKKKYTKLIN